MNSTSPFTVRNTLAVALAAALVGCGGGHHAASKPVAPKPAAAPPASTARGFHYRQGAGKKPSKSDSAKLTERIDALMPEVRGFVPITVRYLSFMILGFCLCPS